MKRYNRTVSVVHFNIKVCAYFSCECACVCVCDIQIIESLAYNYNENGSTV